MAVGYACAACRPGGSASASWRATGGPDRVHAVHGPRGRRAPRLTLLRADRVVGRAAKTVVVRARTAARATLRIAGRSYAVGGRTKTLRVRLPARPRRGVLTVRYELRGAGGRARGTLQILRM